MIAALRRDLSGANARLSDVSGEMSESQKWDMEKNRELLLRREAEITELRQQMAKLSKIIDKQKEDLKALHEELRLVFCGCFEFDCISLYGKLCLPVQECTSSGMWQNYGMAVIDF